MVQIAGEVTNLLAIIVEVNVNMLKAGGETTTASIDRIFLFSVLFQATFSN